MASRFCQECGAPNEANAVYCTKCGATLTSGLPPPAPSTPPPPAWAPPGYAAPGYPAAPSPYPAWDYGGMERQKQVDRTKKGVLLLLIGSAIGWLPVIGLLGGLLILVGAIFVILGRKAFGPAHRRNVVISIVLFFVGIVIAVVGAVVAALVAVAGISPSSSEAALTAVLSSAFTNILVIVVVGGLISGIASVFFTYALQTKEGRILLWAAYVANVVIQIAILIIVIPLVQAAAATIAHEIVTSQTVNTMEISNAVAKAEGSLPLLGAISSLLYAAAYYLVWQRIVRREIPEGPPGAPAPPGWPSPGMPPATPPPPPPPSRGPP